MSTDQKPLFTHNTPPPPDAYVVDRRNNKYLKFYDEVLNGEPEECSVVATNNSINACSITDNEAIIKAEQNVIVAAGNFLAETSHGAAVHGQNIGSNTNATKALDVLFDAYTKYHNILDEVSKTEAQAKVDTTVKVQDSQLKQIDEIANRVVAKFPLKVPVKTPETPA